MFSRARNKLAIVYVIYCFLLQLGRTNEVQGAAQLTDATFSDAISACLDEAADTGLCTVYGAESGYGTMPNWDVSLVTDMSDAFKSQSTFNADLSKWDVSSVTDMNEMFRSCTKFNADISKWDVSSVTDMSTMFYASYFNGDLSDWDVSSVRTLENTFYSSPTFNSDISNWDVSSVTSMANLFRSAKQFNQDITKWNTMSVSTFSYMFSDATAFKSKYSCGDSGPPSSCSLQASWIPPPPPPPSPPSPPSPPPSPPSPPPVPSPPPAVALTDATFTDAISACLDEAADTGLCTVYGAESGYGTMPNWDVSLVTYV